jgi:hypothetical protein
MRASLHIDSANDDELRRALLAWHFTSAEYEPPKLELNGMTVKVGGPAAWTIDSPPIPVERAAKILHASLSQDSLDLLREHRDNQR